MSNPSGEGSSECHGSGDGLHEELWSAGLWRGLTYIMYEGSAAEPRRFLESDMA